jgi:hypothetical protein
MRNLLVSLQIFGLLALPSAVFAASSLDASSTGLSTTGGAAFGDDLVTGDNASLSYFIGSRLIKPVFGIVGTIFFALTVYAGILWMTAQGEPKKVQKAKDILITSVIGTVIVVSAYVITNAVFSGIVSGTIT